MREYSIVFKEGLGKGLRKTAHSSRNQQWLVESTGAIPEDGVLKALEELSSPSTVANESYPYPQIFNLQLRTLVCSAEDIYEYVSGSLTKVYDGNVEGTTWSVADFGEYIVLTNGQIVVERNPLDGVYSKHTAGTIPTGSCICNLNGQLLVGTPDVLISSGFTGE